jgi:hypothetical protein
MKNETEIHREIEGLRHLTTAQLKEKYREVFGGQSRSDHKQFLFRRIAWRIQANAWGGLSERARRRALEIADDADLRIRAPKNYLKDGLDGSRTVDTRIAPGLDPRLPLPGSDLVRRYQGKDVAVRVRQDGGFECNGKVDRLTRSLFDFARIVEVLDKQGVSFVAVTRQVNTTASLRRLTLNILLSFAQFEREIAERSSGRSADRPGIRTRCVTASRMKAGRAPIRCRATSGNSSADRAGAAPSRSSVSIPDRTRRSSLKCSGIHGRCRPVSGRPVAVG